MKNDLKTDMIYTAVPKYPIQHVPMPDIGFDPYYTINIDIDDTLCAFSDLYFERTGHHNKEFIGDDDGFWKAFREGKGKGKNFFAEIEPYPYYLNFLTDIQQIASENEYKVQLLSALSIYNPESLEQQAIDKTKWVQRYLWDYGIEIPAIYVESSKDKKLFSRKREILIDDLDKNISQWRIAGGIGILHKNFTQSIQELKMVLDLHKM